MSLSGDQVLRCRLAGLEVGWDVDDAEPQLSHLCWSRAVKGFSLALCGTSRLWFSGGDAVDKIDCPACVTALDALYAQPEKLLAVAGELAAEIKALEAVQFAASEFVWSLDNKVSEVTARLCGDPVQQLREALKRYEGECCDGEAKGCGQGVERIEGVEGVAVREHEA